MLNMTYCLKFKLYAQHYIKIDEKPLDCHSHSWRIAVYIDANKQFEHFYKFEKIINELLDEYSNGALNDHPGFERLEPTLENIGEVLFSRINLILKEYDTKLIKLEVSETPSRIYVVRNKYDRNDNPHVTITPQKFMNKLINNTVELSSKKYNIKNTVVIDTEAEEFEDINENEEPDMEYKSNNSEESYKNITLKTLGSILFILLSGIILILYVNRMGREPWGSDAFGHIFKSDLLYKSILEGDFYPLYTNLWYNGIQPFRYWAPIPYYIMALFQYVAKGDAVAGYNLFIYFCYVAGAFGWLLWGIKEKRILVSVVLGVVWFAMPDNVRVFFSEGNIPRVTIAFLLPYMFFFIWQFIEYNKKYALVAIIFTMALISMCHLMIAAMLGITTFVFLVFYGIKKGGIGRPLQTIFAMLLGISLCGAWLYPALQGGLMNIDAEAVAEVMKLLTFPFTQSLNPMLRFDNIEIYYFGISFFIVALLGVFLSNRKSSSGFLTVLTVFLGTTTALVPILIKLPLNQLLWMMRFTPIAYAVFSLSIILWKDIKKYAMVILLLIVIIDSGFSFKILAFNASPSADTVHMLNEAAAVADQRIAIMDSSEFGSFPSYYLCSEDNETPYAYGWAWQGATTAENIVLLNTALEQEYFGFMFDRLLELGCDTVLVKKDKIKDIDELSFQAGRSEYYLIMEFNNGLLYKRQTPKSFGMTVKYYGLAIGGSASLISLDFPGYQIGNSHVLDDYTLDELLQYEMVYVSGFTYRQKSKAEKLLYDAAHNGVKVIIDMNRVPNDPLSNRLSFMSVTAQPIQFENKLPNLHVKDVVYFPTTFKEEFRNWNTVYLEDVPNPTGFSWMGGNSLTFIGTGVGENENITYVGFNLLYHGMVNEDNMMVDIYAGVMGKNAETLPEREVFPTEITIKGDKIIIETPAENVNTTLANLDAFVSEQQTEGMHNLLIAKQTHTEIDITYPYLKEGIIISLTGLMLSIAFLWISFNTNSFMKYNYNYTL